MSASGGFEFTPFGQGECLHLRLLGILIVQHYRIQYNGSWITITWVPALDAEGDMVGISEIK
jgi:hypothetical protein